MFFPAVISRNTPTLEPLYCAQILQATLEADAHARSFQVAHTAPASTKTRNDVIENVLLSAIRQPKALETNLCCSPACVALWILSLEIHTYCHLESRIP
jgi:hypothetical protein